ncbi:MAG: hypothetical protein OXG51_10630 [Gammaproteobacteria bacterium]|nr:hypothetical protein [Gammaproteobacteria bacterium]
MTDDEIRGELNRLNGRIGALEVVCTVILFQLVSGDADARRTLSKSLLASVEEIAVTNSAREGIVDTTAKIAANLVRDL